MPREKNFPAALRVLDVALFDWAAGAVVLLHASPKRNVRLTL
jgi:hypothetical protein